jgi:UDP-N-acetyl-D-glucosamine dehydrogenase
MSRLHTLWEWIDGVEARETRVAVIGLGYVGLPLALLFAEAGFRVTGLDVDAAKVNALNAGGSYIQRRGRRGLWRRRISSRSASATPC